MLPSKGYFKALTCPFYENGLCGRPHCHYRHCRKEKYDPQDTSSIQAEEAQAGKENYVEGYTDDAVETFLYENLLSKSEGETLNESALGRESLLEQVYNGLRMSSLPAGHKSTPPEVPSYKPTPISELKKRHIPVAFDPNIVKYAVPKSRSVKKPKPEYVPRGENGKEVIPPASYSPTPSQLIKRDSSHEYLPVGSSWNHTYTPSKITSLNSSNSNDNAIQLSDSIGSPLYSVGFSTGLSGEYDGADFDLDEIAPELDLIGQLVDDGLQESDENSIDNESDTQENSLDSLSLNISSTCYTSDIEKVNKGIPTDTLEKCDISEDDLLKLLGGEKEEVKNNKDNSKTEKHSNLKPGRTKEEKSRHKSSSSSSKHSSSNKHSSSSSSRSHSKSSSSKSSHSKSKHHSSSSSSSKEKSSHSSSSSKKKTDHHSDKSKNKDSQEQKHSNSSKSHSSDKYKSSHRSHKNGDNTNSSGGSKSHKNDEKDSRKRKHSESHSRDSKHSKKEKPSSKSDSRNKSSLSDSKHKSKDQKSKDSSGKVKKNEDEYKSSSSDVEEVPLHSPVDAIVITDSDDSDVDINSDLVMSDTLHEEQPMDTHFTSSDNENIEPQLPTGSHDVPLPQIKEKKRISHLNVEDKQKFSRHIPPVAKIVVANPSQTLIERWHKKRFAESDSAPVPVGSSLSEDLPGPPTKVRIAHVPNVSSLLNAKKNILTGSSVARSSVLLNRFKNMSNFSSSSAGGGSSSGPRAGPSAAVAGPSGAVAGPSRAVAGPSGAEGNPPPLILPDSSSKINVVQRQLHLDRLFGLCLQVYSVEVAKKKAAQLELECCQASKSMMTYKNKISQAYLKLKKELSVLTGEEMPEPEKPTGEITEEEVYKLMQKYLLPQKDLVEFSIPIRIKGKSECCGYIDPKTLPDRRPKNMPPAPLPEEGKFECLLCFSTFTVDENGFSIEGGCQYHLARPSFVGKGADRTIRYDCCGDNKGCVIKDCHVRDTIDVTCMPGFVETLPAPPHIKKEECGVYALDCEMCFTTVGLELVRCTVVNYKGETIFDELAIPPNPIIDYNTRFSGIEERHLIGVTNTPSDVRQKLMEFIHAETILIGHGLGNDLKALKMIHAMIVDTTYVFPHKLGAPRKRRLAELSKEYLCREIQNNGAAGHDSSEDATACMDLMLKKIRHDKKTSRPRKIIGFTPPPKKSAPPLKSAPQKKSAPPMPKLPKKKH